ncbi:hypothetical protein B0O99DRAFT_596501 [Bisporella sp. PMI_857]|nr:hypothetical protein B0O99DRAFT_596501 [Bisporella sp. PMI_857]
MAMDHTSGIAEFAPGTTVTGERKLEFVLHNTDYQSENCSLALSYDTQKSITKEVLSMGPGDGITNLLVHLEKSKHLLIHPMLLPALLFCKLAEASVSHKNILKQEIKWLEHEIAAVHLREKSKWEDAPGEEIDQINLNRRLNMCLMRQAQRHGRRQFCQQFEEALELSFIEMETLAKEAKLCDLQRAHQELGRLKAFKTLILKVLKDMT